MVTKKTKESEFALSKNNGESVKYRIRKQEEFEAEDLLKEYKNRQTEDIPDSLDE